MKKILLTTVISLAFVLPNQVKAKISENQGKPVIFNYNEGALPGEAFGVQGDAFGQAAELWYALVDGSEKELKPQNQLTVLSKSNINVAGLLPDEKILPKGLLIAVWVKNGQQLSEPVFINRARVVTVEFEEIMSGYPFRVFGRNLSFSGQKPSLQFYDQEKKNSFPAEIIHADPNVLQLKAPQGLVSGTRYTLKVSNGFGGKWGESEVEETMLAKESVPDPFGVGAPWGADFKFYKNIYNVKTDSRLTLKAKGNGIANDRAAIQQAIDKANADGGGVIYFPQGKYKLDFASGSGLIMRSNVVLKGEGAENSIIQYGFGAPPAYIDPIGKVGWPDETVEGVAFLWPLGTKLSGLSDLCIQNVNTSGIWRHSLKTMPPKERCPGSAGSEFFAVNCRFDLSTGCGLAWSFIDKMVVSGCDFVSYSQNTWPWMWHCDGSANFAIRNNRVHYAAGRFGFNESYNGIIENNHITRFGDLQTFKGESGGFNIDYSNDIVVMKNKMDVIGAPILSRGQGETILSQGCNPEGQTFGVVTEATATTVTDNNKQWGTFNPLLLGSSRVVAIVNGKGTGQYRYIKGSKGHSIMIDRPWDVVPEPGSRFVINTWSAEDWLVKDNILEDNDQGIMFYCGCNDVLIEGNKLTNSSGIYIRSDQRAEAGRFNLTWNTSVENNEVIRTQGTRAVSIYSLLAMQPKQALIGTGTIGLEIRRNLVQAKFPNVQSSVPGEGYWNNVRTSTPAVLDHTIGILGTIFEKNTAINCDLGYRLSGSISQTIIKDPVHVNVPVLTNESTIPESSRLETVVIAK
ncbi:MAG: glycosyl hydrolase family 28-related protein [Bacteroidales bacterium]|nr:glycosyl hydrolase family 28-related protein [Bacteroidales bacterium]